MSLPTTLPVLETVVDQTRTRFTTSFERPIAPGVAEVVDGMAMVGVYTDPIVEQAAPSQGTGTEVFLGTATVGVVNVKQLPLVEQQIAPVVSPAAPVSITLQRTPYIVHVTDFHLYNGATEILPGVPTANDTPPVYSIAGSVVTVSGNLMGVTLTAVYVYQPTFNEVLARFHQASVNMDNVAQMLQQVGIGGGADSEIFTNYWDSLHGQFVNGGAVKLGGNGYFTAGGSGNTIGIVINAPTAEDSTLGFRVTVV